jgi:spermidine synthase
VPSFGEWGFMIASRRPWRLPTTLPAGLRFLNLQSLPLLFDFPQDMARVPAEVNRLSNQVLVHTYETEWGRVTQGVSGDRLAGPGRLQAGDPGYRRGLHGHRF